MPIGPNGHLIIVAVEKHGENIHIWLLESGPVAQII